MQVQSNCPKKVCSFYASDLHFIMMLIPYISKSLDEGVKVNTILQESHEENVRKITTNLSIKNKSSILNLDWDSKQESNGKIDELINNINEIEEKSIIIINGNKKYLNDVNNSLERLSKNKENCTIINCYSAEEVSSNFSEILNDHDKIINTNGEQEICDIFKLNK